MACKHCPKVSFPGLVTADSGESSASQGSQYCPGYELFMKSLPLKYWIVEISPGTELLHQALDPLDISIGGVLSFCAQVRLHQACSRMNNTPGELAANR